ncbi:MAG: hypothetical protein ACI9LG_002144 [Moritella dasanensis]|jgi:hypothetical protein
MFLILCPEALVVEQSIVEPSDYSILLGQIDSIKEVAKSNLEQLSSGQYLTELKSRIDTSKQEVEPEDDLDCLMLSNSVIPAIVRNKQKRQLIIVSHSAPIVVNGDAEYVISMKHDSQGLRYNIQGALQEQAVKDNICNQMEGGEKAFRSRFNRILN